MTGINSITVAGIVATNPRHLQIGNGEPLTSFRLAAPVGEIGVETNWYSVAVFGALAVNAVNSIIKGDRVLVTGALRVREWESENRGGFNAEIEAVALGHDLNWGTTQLRRAFPKTTTEEES
jgi:Single-stranded DNA-binding protein